MYPGMRVKISFQILGGPYPKILQSKKLRFKNRDFALYCKYLNSQCNKVSSIEKTTALNCNDSLICILWSINGEK